MKSCRISKLKIDINYTNIINKFTVVRFSSTEKYIKYGSLFLDEINDFLTTKSVVFEKGKSFYALFDKSNIEKINITNELRKLTNSNELIYDILDSERKLKEIPKHLLTQLLINSLSNPNRRRLSFNNLSGKFYLFHTNHFEINKSSNIDKVFKIVALEVKINQSLSLELNVKTFSNVLLSKKMDFSKKKFRDYPKYTFVHSTNTLRRVLKSDDDVGNQFILKQTKQNGRIEKNYIPFLDFKSLDSFKMSKIGLLNDVLLNIQNKLSDYISLSFLDVDIDNVIRFSDPFKVEKQSMHITLIDCVGDEDSTDIINHLLLELELVLPQAQLKVSKKERKNGFNIKLIHNKSYYAKYSLVDPYKPSSKVQHITIEDFKVNSKATINAIVKELIIKNDIDNNQITITEWQDYNFIENWVFGYKINNDFFFLSISPKGKLDFKKFERNLFNQGEYDELCDIFYDDLNTEFIVKDDKGNINCINKTQNFTIPKYESIFEILCEENKKLKISKEELVLYLKEIFKEEKQNEFISKINSLQIWTKKSLLSCFLNRADKKKVTEIVRAKTGEILKSYLRDKTRYEILDSQLDIHYYIENGEHYYFVGTKGSGIQQQIPRASVIRKITNINNSEFVFEKLLPLMNVDFVKNGNLTVLPFPIKYLREWIKSQN